jgi:hypothetical protein
MWRRLHGRTRLTNHDQWFFIQLSLVRDRKHDRPTQQDANRQSLWRATQGRVSWSSSIVPDATPERGHRSILSAAQRCHEGCRGKRHTHSITSPAGQQCGGIRPFLFLFAGIEGWLPRCAFRLGAAAIILIFSFFGFLASRLPLCFLLPCRSPWVCE